MWTMLEGSLVFGSGVERVSEHVAQTSCHSRCTPFPPPMYFPLTPPAFDQETEEEKGVGGGYRQRYPVWKTPSPSLRFKAHYVQPLY